MEKNVDAASRSGVSAKKDAKKEKKTAKLPLDRSMGTQYNHHIPLFSIHLT